MSVCFFVPAEQSGAAAEEQEQDAVLEDNLGDSSHQTLQQFWNKVTDDIKKVNADDFKTQALPLARIKKIMKLDEEVKMISAEAPVLFAKACEIFIHELTLRAWSHTEDNKRRTLQRNDIAMALSKSDMFDFLIDIVPRHEVVKTPSSYPRDTPQRSQPAEQAQATQCTATIQSPAQPQFVIQQQIPQQIVQPSSSQSSTISQQPVTLMQQMVAANGEVQQVPIQLTQSQLNMIRLQVQNNPNQPIIIQAAPAHQSQIIQMSSHPHPHQTQSQQQVYLAQVQSQDDS